jgi:gluconolactonase
VYFTDPLFTKLDQRDLDFYGVFHVTPEGQIETVSRGQTRPNGIALSPDGRILYVANTDERNVKRYDLDSAGRASGERVLATLDAGPDGMKVDVNGNLYFAARGGVHIYSPTGASLGLITAPVSPRNIAFGDADFRMLYLVGNSIYRVRLDVAGSVQY